MDAASKIHVRLPRNVGDRADASFSHPPEQGSKGRTAQRHGKKSLRNAQDSAEMARRGRSNTTTSADAASRPGRHLEIANVGDNGTIYLRYEPEGAENTTMERTLSMSMRRPTARPENDFAYIQHFVSPPLTPPHTSHDRDDTPATRTSRESPAEGWPTGRYGRVESVYIPPVRRPSTRQRRTYSFSTLDSTKRSPSFESARLYAPRSRRPSALHRPKTAENLAIPMLQVPIPHYRIGTPQFSERGTAFLHNSVYSAMSGADDMSSSAFTNRDFDMLFPAPPGRDPYSARSGRLLPARRSSSFLHSDRLGPAAISTDRSAPTPPASEEGTRQIDSSIYDEIAADPDHPDFVRYAPATGDILAATAARLIVQITAVGFLDYELLSDFFLTYRSFMTSAELVRYLMARMRWAVMHNNDSGRIVRVRTFVAIRHWILNYFIDDFEPDYDLRILFCDLTNQLSLDVQQRPGGGGGDSQVLGELKKCWRRTCALIWNMADDGQTPLLEHQLQPSGEAEAGPSTPPEQLRSCPPVSLHNYGNLRGTTPQDVELRSLPPNGMQFLPRPRSSVPASPFSERSLQATSCSIPMRKRARPTTAGRAPRIAQPHSDGAQTARPETSATMTRRPTHGHKRSGSFSDALRDDRAPLPFSSKIDLTDLENLPPQNVTGGLIRGILVQPGSPYIVSYAPLSPPLRATMHYLRVGTGFLEPPSPNPSVAKTLMGNVRRALSTRHNASAPIGNAQGMKSSSGSRRHRRLARQNSNSADSDCGKRPQKMRSDFLAATVIRVYAQHAQRNTVGIHDSEADSPPTQEPQAEPNALGNKASAPSVRRLDSHVTTGSRSIVIIDDTGSSDARSHTGRGKTPNSTVQSGYFGRAHAGTPDMSWMLVESLDPPERQSSLASATILDFSKVSASVPDLATLAAAQRESSNAASPLEAPVRVDHRSAIARTFDSPGPSSPVDEVQQTPQEVVLSPRKSSLTNPAELDLTPVAPNRLRRRPGGNLRAVDNVHDLGLSHRRRSTGSTSSITYSTSTSVAYSRDVSYVQVAPRSSRSRQNSRDAQAQELQRKPSLRLLSTHSSQPNLRASFEAEVHRLASMPHDEEDGDIESTLLKLEGKFAKSSPHLLLPPTSPDEAEFSALTRQPAKNRVLVLGHPDHPQTSRLDLSDDGLASPMTNRQGASIYHLSQTSAGTYSDQPGQSLEETRLSGESVALLDNGLNDVVKRTRRSSMMIWPRGSTPPSASASKTGHSKSGSVATPTSAHSRKHFEHAKSPKQGSQRTITNRPATAQSSFLLDDHESLSGDEAALEADVKSQSRDDLSTRGVRSFFFDEDDDDDDDGVDEVEALPEPARSPLTPPSTAGIPTPNEGQVQDLTPGPAPPTHVEDGSSFPERLKPVIAAGPRIGTIKKIKTAPPITPPQTEHVPYILAYGSEDLARQFTIIEKDALEEVDWKELIDIKWKQSPPRAHNWADFVHMETASGIDIITARFNLVVKWVVSECLLTEDIDERAHCFVKFIHIAAHARRMRNYATMYQVAVAMLSSDMARLTKTWDLVPTSERETLRELETLVEPKRNFANLRTEMESTIIDHGCIPFIGVYTRDLLTNAQKPAFIDPVPPYTEPLINFERFQTAATIVKGMLRLLEASARYDLVPEPELLARCLWLAALDDAEITARSKALQQ